MFVGPISTPFTSYLNFTTTASSFVQACVSSTLNGVEFV